MIEIQGLTKAYPVKGGGTFTAIEGIDLTIQDGDIFGIIGMSGAGKSTLVRCINLLEQPTKGSIRIDGVEVTAARGKELLKLRRKIGMVFQKFNLLMQRTILDNVALPLEIAGVDKAARMSRAKELLELVGLGDQGSKYPAQLSGGQQQRVSIARALAGDPSLILADEPTGALDSRTGREVLAFLQKLNAEGDTVVLITHDNSIAVKAKRIVRLQDGKIIYDGDSQDPQAVVQPEEGNDGDAGDGFTALLTGEVET